MSVFWARDRPRKKGGNNGTASVKKCIPEDISAKIQGQQEDGWQGAKAIAIILINPVRSKPNEPKHCDGKLLSFNISSS